MPTIRIEVEGGLVQEVKGLPDGWDYEVADFDVCPDCGDAEPLCVYCREEQALLRHELEALAYEPRQPL